MKFKTFIRIRRAIVAGLAIGSFGLIQLGVNSTEEPQVQLGEVVSAPLQDNRPTPQGTPVESLDEYRLSLTSNVLKGHEKIMLYQSSLELSTGKSDPNNGGFKKYIKDDYFFLDLRCDVQDGFGYWNRVKVDWDKDKQWDEKWTFDEGGVVKRVCSSADNGTYDITLKMEDGLWVSEDGSPLAADPMATAPQKSTNTYGLDTGEELIAAHKEIIMIQDKTLLASGKHDPNNNGIKKFLKMTNYNVDLRCDKEKGYNYWNRVKIDWDKDKKWDEKWFFRKNGVIKRECSTKDNKTYDLVMESSGGKWIRK